MVNYSEMFEYRDGKLFWKVSPSRRAKVGMEAGSRSSHGYILISFQGGGVRRPLYAHRIIWEMHNGPIPDGLQIDHINGVRFDNRLENLRLATRSQNLRNKKHSGAYFDKRRAHMKKPWTSAIKVGDKNKWLGSFATKEEAEMAYHNAARELHGDFYRAV